MRLASLCLILYWLAIFVGTHLPSASLPHMGSSDKLLHFAAFGGLSFLLLWALPTRAGRQHVQAIGTVGLVIAYAALDELTQNFIPGRNCSWGDFVADAIGALAGLLAYFLLRAILVRLSLGRQLIQMFSK